MYGTGHIAHATCYHWLQSSPLDMNRRIHFHKKWFQFCTGHNLMHVDHGIRCLNRTEESMVHRYQHGEGQFHHHRSPSPCLNHRKNHNPQCHHSHATQQPGDKFLANNLRHIDHQFAHRRADIGHNLYHLVHCNHQHNNRDILHTYCWLQQTSFADTLRSSYRRTEHCCNQNTHLHGCRTPGNHPRIQGRTHCTDQIHRTCPPHNHLCSSH